MPTVSGRTLSTFAARSMRENQMSADMQLFGLNANCLAELNNYVNYFQVFLSHYPLPEYHYVLSFL